MLLFIGHLASWCTTFGTLTLARQPRNAPPLNLRKSEATPCSPFTHATPCNATPQHSKTSNTTPYYAIPCQPRPSQTRDTTSPCHTALPDDTKERPDTQKQIHILSHNPPRHTTLRYPTLQQMPQRCATPRCATTGRNMTCPPPHPATPLRHFYKKPRLATRQAR